MKKDNKNKKDQITQTSEDIEFHQSRLKDLQVQNLKLRQEVEKVLNSIKENGFRN